MRFATSFTLLVTLTGLLVGSPARAADPTVPECLAASDASLKSGNEHQLRAERTELLICSSSSCPSEIRKECMRRVDEVSASIPTIVFEVKDPGGIDLSDVKVTMDGEVLAERLDGTALAIDPGLHTFVFEAPNQPSVSKQLVIREAEKDRKESIQLGVAAEGAGAQQPVAPAASSSGGGMPAQKVAAIVALGIGVAGVATGSVFGVMAMQKKDDAEKLCPAECADKKGTDAWSDAKQAGTFSTIGFIVGGVGLAGAALLWFTAPSSTQAQVGIGPGSIQLRGSF